jgi:hypothetical protein
MTRYTSDQLRPGTLVTTPHGSGSINYVRMAPPNYATVEAASVYLENRHGSPNYSGTIVSAEHITIAQKGSDR